MKTKLLKYLKIKYPKIKSDEWKVSGPIIGDSFVITHKDECKAIQLTVVNKKYQLKEITTKIIKFGNVKNIVL